MALMFGKKPIKQDRHPEAKKWDWPLQKNDGVVSLINNSERFKAELEIASFNAHEIEVKVLNDDLIVNCCEERNDDRKPRQIHRTYRLPADVDVSTLKTTVRPQGVLQITADKVKSPFGQIVLNKVNRFA